MPPLLFCAYFIDFEVENLPLSSTFYRFLFYLRSLPLDVCLFAFGSRTTISPLNPLAHGVFSLRIRRNYKAHCIFPAFALDFIGFLMRHPRFVRKIIFLPVFCKPLVYILGFRPFRLKGLQPRRLRSTAWSGRGPCQRGFQERAFRP